MALYKNACQPQIQVNMHSCTGVTFNIKLLKKFIVVLKSYKESYKLNRLFPVSKSYNGMLRMNRTQ